MEDRILYNQLQQTDLFQDGLFAIVDDQDTHIITAQGAKNLQSDWIARLQGAESDSTIIAADTKSEIFDLHYYMLIPQNNFWAEKRSIGNMFCLSIALCLILNVLVYFICQA